jgi:hypothetical protein
MKQKLQPDFMAGKSLLFTAAVDAIFLTVAAVVFAFILESTASATTAPLAYVANDIQNGKITVIWKIAAGQ